jgi:DNA polymerase-3 subunit alpha
MVPEVIEMARRGQMALFDSCDLDSQSVPSSSAQADWDESTKLAHEKAVLGFYLSGHPLSEYRSLMEKLTPGGAARLRNLPVDSRSRLGGMVEEIRVISSRKNEPLHFLQVEDFSGSTEVTVFADVYGKYKSHIYAGALVLVSGRVAKEGGQVKLVADDVVSLEAAAVNLATSVHCHFTVEGLSKEALRELEQLFKSQPGSCPVYLHVGIGRQTVVVHKLPPAWAVRPTRRLITEITGRFGESCLEVHYSEGEAAQI